MFEQLVLKELVKNGYSVERGKRVWNIANHKLLYITPQLAQGFLNLECWPRYKLNVVDRELDLIRFHVPRFFDGARGKLDVVDFGCGDGKKAEVFVTSLPSTIKAKYFPVDVSLPLIHLAKTRLRTRTSRTFSVGPSYTEDFSSPDKLVRRIRARSDARAAYLLLGSTLASFEINQFLFSMSRAMAHGGLLIVGNGIRTGKRFAGIEKYRQPIFNEWFFSLMAGLGFSSSEVRYDARFANGRLEFFYHIKHDKVFVCEVKRIRFKAGDEIVVAIQYKYYAQELEKFCKMYFSHVRFFKDKANECSLIFCIK